MALAQLSPLLLSAADQNPDQAVQLSGVVRDRHGRFVRDLETADFTVTQDGADVAIRNLRLVQPTAAPFVTLIFDRLRGDSGRLAEQAAQKLLAGSPPNTVFSVWLIDDKLVLLHSFSTDRSAAKAAIRSALSKTPLAGTPQGTWAALSTATLETADRLTRESPFGLKVAALIAVAREQRSEVRRKALVYFSEGLPVGSADEGLSNIVSAARQANVTLYTVDATALAVSREEESRREIANIYALSAQSLGHANYKNQPYVRDQVTGENPGIDLRQQDAPPLQTLADQTGGFSISKSPGLGSPMRRIVQDLSSYYEITYMRPAAVPDGRYHPISVKVRRKGAAVSFPTGLYAIPETADGADLPYELPLRDALSRAPILDLPLRAGLWRFRSANPGRTLVAIFFEVAGEDVHFEQDDSAGVVRAHLSALALVRDHAGQVVVRFGGDRPLETPPALLAEARRHPFAFQKSIELPAGQYTLEIAVRDQLGDRVHAEKIAFAVEPDRGGLALSNLSLVDRLAATPGSPSDGAFSLPAKSVLPSLDAAVTGGKDAIATLFFRLYPAAAGAPTELSFELWLDGRQVLRKPLQYIHGAEDPSAQIISLSLEKLPAGQYEIRIVAEQSGRRASESLPLRIAGGAAASASASADTENDGDTIVLKPAEELPAPPPTLDQQQLLDRARLAALSYSQHLPNFICTQVTRRMIDQPGKEQWRNLDEWSQLVSYYDRQEHYQVLGRRGGADDSNAPSLNSVGEFGSLLRYVFATESAAIFAWSRTDSIRGRPVEVFSYRVDLAHSQNRISYRVGTAVSSSLAGFRGLLFIDPVTARVLRITEETDPLPPGLPIRGVSLTLNYRDVEVGHQVYLLPDSFTLEISLRKRTHVRNEVTFRSYQRFSVQSRLVPQP